MGSIKDIVQNTLYRTRLADSEKSAGGYSLTG